jgi:thiol-disulfide isomerase/thioredoxin
MKSALFIFVLLLAACTTAAPDNSAQQPTNAPSEAPTESVQEESARPAWHTIALTNARTGEIFTLADFAGKTVYVEPMATWCVNCRAQMHRVVPVYEELSADSRFAFVSLSVGENIADSDLATYADREGFGWIFAIATPEMLAELTNTFGGSVLTPPSTPHFLIFPDGTDSGLKTGPETTEALRTSLLGS